jgi:hypothetical protein
MQIEEQISKLLGLRLTKFQYGFVLGLKGHEPTPEQRDILRSIIERYPPVFGNKEQNDNADNSEQFADARSARACSR